MSAHHPIPEVLGPQWRGSRARPLFRLGVGLLCGALMTACRSGNPRASGPGDAAPQELVLVQVESPSLDEGVPLTPDPAEREPADGPPPIWFAVVLAPGAQFDGTKGTYEQAGIEGHVQFLQDSFGRGELVMGGPFLDDSGALSLWQARGLGEARALAAADPLVQAEVFAIQSIRPWMVALR